MGNGHDLVLQLHPLVHVASPSNNLQATRCLRMVRRVVLDPLGFDPVVRPRDKGSYFGRVGPGVLREHPKARELSDEERRLALPGVGSEAQTRTSTAVLPPRRQA